MRSHLASKGGSSSRDRRRLLSSCSRIMHWGKSIRVLHYSYYALLEPASTMTRSWSESSLLGHNGMAGHSQYFLHILSGN